MAVHLFGDRKPKQVGRLVVLEEVTRVACSQVARELMAIGAQGSLGSKRIGPRGSRDPGRVPTAQNRTQDSTDAVMVHVLHFVRKSFPSRTLPRVHCAWSQRRSSLTDAAFPREVFSQAVIKVAQPPNFMHHAEH
jgi:hypothetical protein